MAVLNSKFDILRGWPNGSAVAIDVGMKALPQAGAHSFRAGTFVKLVDDGNGRAIADSTFADADASLLADGADKYSAGLAPLGLIIEGLEETSAAMSKTVTILVGGGFVARFHKEASMTQNAFGSANIPNGVDQFDEQGLGGGSIVTVDGGIIRQHAGREATHAPVGVVLGYDSDNETLDVLFH